MKKNHTFIQKANRKRQSDLEYPIHCAIADYLNLVIKRPSRWHTVEVSNQQSGVAGMIKQGKLKRKGCVTGWPDIMIMNYFPAEISCPCGTIIKSTFPNILKLIFLEVKIPGGKLTEKQEVLHKELREDGHEVFVIHSVEETKHILGSLGVI